MHKIGDIKTQNRAKKTSPQEAPPFKLKYHFIHDFEVSVVLSLQSVVMALCD
jgi:hypothetical protein